MRKKIILYLFFICVARSLSFGGIIITNGLTHEFNVEKGMVYRGSIHLENPSLKEQNIKFYFQDYRYYASGEVFYDDPALKHNPRSNAEWISLPTMFLTLKPESKYELPFEIHVPDSLVKDGTFWCMIMAEGVEPVVFDEAPQEAIQIRSVIRYGIQIATHVSKKETKDIVFENFALQYDKEKKPTLSFDIQNSGNVSLKPDLKIELFNKEGKSVKVFHNPRGRIYPEMSIRNTISLSDIEQGAYKALILADTENDDVFATEINIDVKSK